MQVFDDANVRPLGRDELAARVARDIPEGWYVNLGIGIPSLVANYVLIALLMRLSDEGERSIVADQATAQRVVAPPASPVPVGGG